MRIVYYSDIHTEIREDETRVSWSKIYPLDLGPNISELAGSADLVLLAGDIGRTRLARSSSALLYVEQVAEYLGCPVVLVPGNHEYYGGCFLEDRSRILKQVIKNVCILDRNIAYFSYGKRSLRILGATLWTDYLIAGNQTVAMRDAQIAIADHRRIQMYEGERFLPQHALQEHKLTRQWLMEQMAVAHNGPTIIVTHHAPHPSTANPNYGVNDKLSPAFVSDCDELVEAATRVGVIAWIYGHTHSCQTIEIKGVRFLSAQLGYPREITGWNGPGVLELA